MFLSISVHNKDHRLQKKAIVDPYRFISHNFLIVTYSRV